MSKGHWVGHTVVTLTPLKGHRQAPRHIVPCTKRTGRLEFQNHRNFKGFFRYRLAEREGFEPPIELPLCRISSAVHSTALPSLREIERARKATRLVDTGGLMT